MFQIKLVLLFLMSVHFSFSQSVYWSLEERRAIENFYIQSESKEGVCIEKVTFIPVRLGITDNGLDVIKLLRIQTKYCDTFKYSIIREYIDTAWHCIAINRQDTNQVFWLKHKRNIHENVNTLFTNSKNDLQILSCVLFSGKWFNTDTAVYIAKNDSFHFLVTGKIHKGSYYLSSKGKILVSKRKKVVVNYIDIDDRGFIAIANYNHKIFFSSEINDNNRLECGFDREDYYKKNSELHYGIRAYFSIKSNERPFFREGHDCSR